MDCDLWIIAIEVGFLLTDETNVSIIFLNVKCLFITPVCDFFMGALSMKANIGNVLIDLFLLGIMLSHKAIQFFDKSWMVSFLKISVEYSILTERFPFFILPISNVNPNLEVFLLLESISDSSNNLVFNPLKFISNIGRS
jgi:hypothetical protein